MDTKKINRQTTKMVAHRGVSGLERENTNAAFVAAGNRSYFGVETDVHLTADGNFILHHDDSTARLCDTELIIEQTPYAELKKLYLTKGLEVKRRDLIMPDVEDYISICAHYGKIAVLEIKNRMPKEKIRELTAKIDALHYLENTIFISFSWENLVDLKSFIPEQRVQFLCSQCDEELILKLKKNNMDLDIYHDGLTSELVDALHENGIEINCWTVDDPARAEELISWGVDYITSNILE